MCSRHYNIDTRDSVNYNLEISFKPLGRSSAFLEANEFYLKVKKNRI